MASQYIDISGNITRFSGMFRGLVDEARRLQEDATKMVRITEQIKFGAVGSEDWVALAAQLGLGAETAKAQQVYNLLIAFQAVINKPAYDAFIDRIG